MKKKTNVIIGFIAVILVGIIIASQFWPPTEDKDTSGTIGQELANMKNQKIKKTLLKDQQELTDIIEGLKYFNNFISQLTAHFDNNIKNLGEFKENDETKNCINRLEDFNNYIKANKFVVDNTIIMLTNLKENGEADNNDNYKKTLMEFDKFIYQMSIKDSVINNFIDESYVYIEKYGTLESRKHDINNLMSIVDNMVVKDMEYATVVKDDDKMTKGSDAELNIKEDTICKYKDQLKAAFSQEKLSIYDQMKSNIFLYDEDKLGLLPLFSIKNISVPEREPKETAEVTANNIN